jgi:hypothetical protein
MKSMTSHLPREDQERLVYQAITAIAARCDGAISQDGVGFNGSDTKFGRRIALIPFEEWTSEIRQEAARILGNTYRVQAQEWTGIDARELDVVREAADVYEQHDETIGNLIEAKRQVFDGAVNGDEDAAAEIDEDIAEGVIEALWAKRGEG